MGYNQMCIDQLCLTGCCNYYGYCPLQNDANDSCYYYYYTTVSSQNLQPGTSIGSNDNGTIIRASVGGGICFIIIVSLIIWLCSKKNNTDQTQNSNSKLNNQNGKKVAPSATAPVKNNKANTSTACLTTIFVTQPSLPRMMPQLNQEPIFDEVICDIGKKVVKTVARQVAGHIIDEIIPGGIDTLFGQISDFF